MLDTTPPHIFATGERAPKGANSQERQQPQRWCRPALPAESHSFLGTYIHRLTLSLLCVGAWLRMLVVT